MYRTLTVKLFHVNSDSHLAVHYKRVCSSPRTGACRTRRRKGSEGVLGRVNFSAHEREPGFEVTKRRASKKRKQWTNQQMEAAATKGTLSANKAADLHGVTRSTLKDCR